MTESEVLNCAADILQRKVETVIRGAHGKVFTEDVMGALVQCGLLADVADKLRDIADAFYDERWGDNDAD